MENKKTPRFSLALRGGSYTLTITAVVLAILIAVNLFAAALPTTATRYDISASQLYSVTGNTKAVLSTLEEDVTIYWIVQADQEDAVLENLLAKYESLSSHVSVVKKNPDAYPTFAQQYTEETVSNNSLVVESAQRSRYIAYEDIYITESDYYGYTYTTGFDGEGAITSAIDYVVTEELPIVYILEGHGESALPTTFSDAVQKENIETQGLSLLTVDAIPEDADCILIYSPQSDISEIEKTMLADYAAGGGKLLVMSGPVEAATLTNLNGLLSDYGITACEGFVIEGDREYYAFGYPYILMPDMESSAITDPLLEAGYTPLLPLAQGLRVGDSEAVTSLLITSASAFSKTAGFSLSTYEKEEGDPEGPFTLGVSIATDGGGQIVWFSASDFLDDMYNAYSSGANVDLAMNALSSLIGQREALAIRSKSLNYNYLTISEASASAIKLLLIGMIPLMFLGVGIYVILRRRGMQHEEK